MKIEVTESDIQKGKMGDCRRCPVAIAIKRATKEKIVIVGTATFSTSKTNGDLPIRAKNFIYKYDDCGDGRPFSFTIKY